MALVYKENLNFVSPSATTLRKRVMCGGALVASKYVVTTAQCVVDFYQPNNQPSTLIPPGDITVVKTLNLI